MKIVDLSMPLHTGMEVFPGDPEVKMDVVHTYEKNGWELRNLSFGTHTGTHVDAFSHMHQGMASVDQIPVERFLGEAQVVEHSKEWPKNIGLFFTEKVGLESLSKLLEARPRFVGGELTEELERALLKREIITYTHLVNLEKLTKHSSFTFYGLPLKIQKGDGSPVRAIAVVES